MNDLIDKKDRTPYYKQLIQSVILDIGSGKLVPGEILPSMNELSDVLGISKETVKKAYGVLRDRGFIESCQGKGFFVCNPEDKGFRRILLIFDKLSTYKDILFMSFVSKIGVNSHITIRLHNQSPELLRYYLDECLGHFDYYVVTPHFPLDPETRKTVLTQLKRIPNRQFIMLDNWMKELPGNYGAVYQDFDNDIYECFRQNRQYIRQYKRLVMVIFPSSLYRSSISGGVKRFGQEFDMETVETTEITPDLVRPGDVYFLLNGQLDSELNMLVREASSRGLVPGRDIGIISYNDSPINELVLGGLSSVSCDFSKMGERAAQMILQKNMDKVKSPFSLVRRSTF